jgi:hypothetical protein
MSHDKISAAPRKRMAETGGRTPMERKPNALLLLLIGHVLVAAWTWRDIRRRPARQIRGGKGLWRVFSAVNTVGAAAYWLIGRRYGQSHPG